MIGVYPRYTHHTPAKIGAKFAPPRRMSSTARHAPTLVALDTENTPADKVRSEFENAVKIPMTGAKDEVFVFESHLLHSVLEPWSEPPDERVSSRTRSGGNERSTLDRWVTTRRRWGCNIQKFIGAYSDIWYIL